MTMPNDNVIPPVPTPPVRNGRPSYGRKILLMGLLSALLMCGALMVLMMIESRESSERAVTDEIASKWGRGVVMRGPVAVAHPDSVEFVRPAVFDCDVNVESTSLHRGIYEAEVFTADIAVKGTFSRSALTPLGDKAVLMIRLDTRGVSRLGKLTLNGKKYDWLKSNNCLTSEVPISELPETVDFSTDFSVHGSSQLYVDNIGVKSVVEISGEAINPSFGGSRLPDSRDVDGGRFQASWSTDLSGTTMLDELGAEHSSMKFLVGVNHYQKVSRSLKYAFIIIGLTFIAVLFTEILMRRPIPLLNYFLIGVALILFYSLLLAFSEFLSFGLAYLIAAAMTVGLITGYMWMMLGSCKVAVTMSGILSAIYFSCYIMLNASDYAMLLGSMILFLALAAMMYGSLKIKR